MQNIHLEHPEYVAKKGMWKKYRDLYAGGELIKQNAGNYLARRQKEPGDVYAERLDKVFYENYIGSIIDWYAATLFRREPVVQIEGPDETGRKFVNGLLSDCDLKGTSLTDFMRKQIVDVLVCGTSYVLTDFPKLGITAESRADEERIGVARAYMVDCPPESIINWSKDANGAFDWVVIRNVFLRKEKVENDRWTEETRWSYYDRQRYKVFRNAATEPGKLSIELIDEGWHGFAKQQRVPLFETKVSDGLWLMNKAALLQLEHFNKSNALSWALTMGLFATPVIYSDREWNQVVGESYYIQLGPQDRFGWTEPEGKVFQIASTNLTRLQEEIYRVCYLMTQAGSGSGAAHSGLSKLRDFAVAQEVLRAYGDLAKNTIRRVLAGIGAAREDDLQIDVAGLDEFDIGDFSSDLQDATNLLSLGIPSDTMRKQIFKRLAQKYLCDSRQEIKDQIAQEIEGSH